MKNIKTIITIMAATLSVAMLGLAQAELLAMMSYESKADNPSRREGIAIVDIDPKSAAFGRVLADLPLASNLVAHHISYNKDSSKAYISSLGKSELVILDLTKFPYRPKTVALPGCMVGEDVAFSEKTGKWYLTCMGSAAVIVGDQKTDQVLGKIVTPKPYPHGIAINDSLDRMLLTSTLRPDMGEAGEDITEIELSTQKVIATYKVSSKPSPSAAAPVEVFFVPAANPAVAYVTNVGAGDLWLGEWQPQAKTFKFRPFLDLKPLGQASPLEIYFNKNVTQAYVTSANPGYLNIFDIRDPRNPKLLSSVKTAPGSHHVVFSPDERYAFVQNSLLNLPGVSDGSISIVDLVEGKLVGSMDTLKNMGFNPNNIILLPGF